MGKFSMFILFDNNSILVIKKLRKLFNSSSSFQSSCSSLIKALFPLAGDFRILQVLMCKLSIYFQELTAVTVDYEEAETTGIIGQTSREKLILTLCQMLSYWIRWWHSRIYSIIWRPTCFCHFPHSPSVLLSPLQLPRTSGNLGNRVWFRFSSHFSLKPEGFAQGVKGP